MSAKAVMIWCGVVFLALGSGVWAGYHTAIVRAEAAQREADAWRARTDSAYRLRDDALEAHRRALREAAAIADRESAAAKADADRQRQNGRHWRLIADSLRRAQPVTDTALVAAQDSTIAALTEETSHLRASLTAQIRASAQYQVALAASDSALALTRARVAQLDSVIRATPPPVPRGTFRLRLPGKPLAFVAGVLIGLAVK